MLFFDLRQKSNAMKLKQNLFSSFNFHHKNIQYL